MQIPTGSFPFRALQRVCMANHSVSSVFGSVNNCSLFTVPAPERLFRIFLNPGNLVPQNLRDPGYHRFDCNQGILSGPAGSRYPDQDTILLGIGSYGRVGTVQYIPKREV